MTIAIPSETAFNYIFLTALGFAILAALVTLLITGRSDQVHIEREREEPVNR